jgi:thioglycine synthase
LNILIDSSWQLGSAKKIYSDKGPSTRTKSTEETLSEIIPICRRIGVTRIADITYLDKLNIPNYSAVLPGTEDSIWVYSGKGPTRSQAKAGAIMEAIERYSSLSSHLSLTYVRGTYQELSKSYKKVLHPNEVVEPVYPMYNSDNSILDFLPGFDLINNVTVLVPASLVLSKYSPKYPVISPFWYSHTNGLASGNVLEEAICHALCEIIERDAISIADLCASFIPYTVLQNIQKSLQTGLNIDAIPPVSEYTFVDDSSLFPIVDISGIAKECEHINFLLKRFTSNNIPLLIKDITSKDLGIPSFVASSSEWIGEDYGLFAKGFGTHPDARIAIIRAITEVAQTRAVNIQGARDDLRRIRYKQNDEIYNRKWQFMSEPQNKIKRKAKTIEFCQIDTYSNADILDDIKLLLNRLKRAGLRRAIIVDLTNPNVGIPVVRAIVPGLETFEVAKLFASQCYMGNRAKSRFFAMCINNESSLGGP